MTEKLNALNKLKDRIKNNNENNAITNQHSKGKLTARERVNQLFDSGTFVEIGLLLNKSNNPLEVENFKTEGVVTGYGQVNGRLVYIAAQDYTVIGGSLSELHADKIIKCQKAALKVGAPIIYIVDSSGVKVEEGINILSSVGEIINNCVFASGVIPQITMIMGPCEGIASVTASLSDFIFMIDGISKMFLIGPQALGANNENVTIDEIGSSKVHCDLTGIGHFNLKDEISAINKLKELLEFLPENSNEKPEELACDESNLNRVDASLNDLIKEDANQIYNMKDVIISISDNSKFLEVQESYAKNILTGFIHLGGKSVGVVANQPENLGGAIDINASNKAARFIRTCDCFNIPILTLVDAPGFIRDKKEELNGISKHISKLQFAYAEATVPKVTVIVHKAYGGAYITMGTKHLKADYCFAWCDAEISIMEAQAATNILYGDKIKNASNPTEELKKVIAEYKSKVMSPYIAASKGYIDDIIEPAETRKILIASFDALETKSITKFKRKHSNIQL